MGKSLLLMSGGLDSSSVAYYLSKKGLDFDCLIINYGQRSAIMQLKASKEVCRRLNKKLIKINIGNVSRPFIDGNWLRPHEPIVHRNVVIIPIALTLAKEKGYKEVILGTVKEDCEFEQERYFVIRKLKELGEVLGVKLSTPFAGFPKWLLLKFGLSSGLDPAITYSCLLGHKYHCGQCSQCKKRIEAFKALKIKDPTPYLS
ncbi:7-cyano-7-deazaguanine synthase [Stygiolobus caldivivus]|uniref:7-cyano-7-deazaguanine synthase n=1 Tax=Stygiolobus caldivivus TaxID=2824673 RepID=A0A8D5U497_9CREN|nr:7-cyano-7-deazaguanine synthase [Stygiolobus caldivivus]BCU69131.1 7-cyano-7-deazaguanine synthase [Stygiolobus caldivivus]